MQRIRTPFVPVTEKKLLKGKKLSTQLSAYVAQPCIVLEIYEQRRATSKLATRRTIGSQFFRDHEGKQIVDA